MCSECLSERTAGRLSECFEYATDIGYDPAMTYASVYRNNYLIDCWLNPVDPLNRCTQTAYVGTTMLVIVGAWENCTLMAQTRRDAVYSTRLASLLATCF